MKYKIGQELICIGLPPKDFEFFYGNFPFEQQYSILRKYIIKSIQRNNVESEKSEKADFQIEVLSNKNDIYGRNGWFFTETEMPQFFMVIE